MSKADIAQKRERERDEWTKRGIAGTVSSLNAATNEISVDTRTPQGPKPIVIAASAQTQFRRYAPDSVRFSDAKPSTFAELKVGDQLRALGTKSDDGARFTAEIVAGSFQTIGGPITEINVEKQEIKINDLQSKQPVTVVVSKDSTMRKFTHRAGDLQEMFDQPDLHATGTQGWRSDSDLQHEGADPRIPRLQL